MDIRSIDYMVRAFMPDGSYMDITPAVLQLSWQDPAEEIAQRASITLAQAKTRKGLLHSLIKLCTPICIFANKIPVFYGVVWEWEYESSTKQEITVTCYDYFIYATRSKAFQYFPAGKSTKDIVSAICASQNIKLKYEYDSIKHAKTIFKNETISDQILTTLDDAKKQLKAAPVAFFDKDTLWIKKKGANKDVYLFDAKQNTISTNERITMDNLVTKVAVYGKENNDGRSSIEATVTGNTKYGTLQEIVFRDGDDTLAAAKAEAQKIIDENGKPKRTSFIQAPDVPTMRKGDKIKLSAGSLIGFFYVKGVTHNAHDRQMTMEVEVI